MRVSPGATRPEIDGATEFDAGPSVTAEVALENAYDNDGPTTLVRRAPTRSWRPNNDSGTVNVAPVAPAMSVQVEVDGSRYCHLCEVVGDASPWSFHVPFVAVSTEPLSVEPETVGTAEFTGTADTMLEVQTVEMDDELPAASVAAPAATCSVSVPLEGEPEDTPN